MLILLLMRLTTPDETGMLIDMVNVMLLLLLQIWNGSVACICMLLQDTRMVQLPHVIQ